MSKEVHVPTAELDLTPRQKEGNEQLTTLLNMCRDCGLYQCDFAVKKHPECRCCAKNHRI